jgi:F-type H+-transporting ATPase subunit a
VTFFRIDPHTAIDTLQHAGKSLTDTARVVGTTAAHGSEKFEFTHLFDHIKDSPEIEIPFGHIALPQFESFTVGGLTIDLSITKHVFFIWIAALILLIAAISSARNYRKSLVPRGFTNAFETIIVFIRDEVVIANMGKQGLKYLPYLLTTFFFILLMNLMGLIPYGATSTSNVAVTAGLAAIAFIMIQVAAIRAQGVGHYLAHLTGGVPWFLWPIMVPIEIIGLFTKPFALCIRLFANMTGGHLVILSLIGLIFIFQSYVVSPVPILFVVAINMLELFVAFLQAYIFTMLTSLFMGMGIQAAEHQEEHAH